MKITGFNLTNFNNNNLFLKKEKNNTNLNEKKVDFLENKNFNQQITFSSTPYYKLLNYNKINFGARKNIDEDIKKAKENYEAGKTAKDFCEQTGHCIAYYYVLLRKAGIFLGHHVQPDFLERVKANHEAGLPQKEFCEKEGCSKLQYWYAKKKLNLGPSKITQQREEELAKKIIASHNAGNPIYKFCEKEKCSFEHYKKILKEKFGIEYSEEQKRSFLIQKAKEHYLSGKPYKEFCEKYNVSMRTYYTYLKAAGLVLTEYKSTEELKHERENPELAETKQISESSSQQNLRKKQQRRTDLDNLVKLAKLHFEQGGTTREFCEKYCCQ